MASGFFRGLTVGLALGSGGFFLADRAGLIGGGSDVDYYIPPAENSVSDSITPLPAPPVEEPAPLVFDPPAIDLPPIELEPAPPAVPEVTLIPEFVTPGVLYDYTGQPALAPLTIVTSAGRDYYVKLVYTGTNDAVMGIYVQGGITSDVQVPLGSYEMRYASGTIWYGYLNLFGPETAYAKAAGTFDFIDAGDSYTGYTVELIMQEGGNLETYGIGPEQF